MTPWQPGLTGKMVDLNQEKWWIFHGSLMAAWWYTYPSEKYESQLG
jgi:hypothetical protein